MVSDLDALARLDCNLTVFVVCKSNHAKLLVWCFYVFAGWIHIKRLTMSLIKRKSCISSSNLSTWKYQIGLRVSSKGMQLWVMQKRICHNADALWMFAAKCDLFAAQFVERQDLHCNALSFQPWRWKRLRNENWSWRIKFFSSARWFFRLSGLRLFRRQNNRISSLRSSSRFATFIYFSPETSNASMGTVLFIKPILVSDAWRFTPV